MWLQGRAHASEGWGSGFDPGSGKEQEKKKGKNEFRHSVPSDRWVSVGILEQSKSLFFQNCLRLILSFLLPLMPLSSSVIVMVQSHLMLHISGGPGDGAAFCLGTQLISVSVPPSFTLSEPEARMGLVSSHLGKSRGICEAGKKRTQWAKCRLCTLEAQVLSPTFSNPLCIPGVAPYQQPGFLEPTTEHLPCPQFSAL